MDVFDALADPVRRDLLRRVSGESVRVADLARAHSISRPAVSKHLRILVDAGLVAAEDRGRERHYRLQPAGLEPVVGLVATLTRRAPVGETALDGLELEVRRTVRERRRPQPTGTGQHSTGQHSTDQHGTGQHSTGETA